MNSASPTIGEDGLLHGLNPAAIPCGAPTVAAILDGLSGDAPALVDSAETLSYSQLGAVVRAATAALQAMGLKQGDRVAATGTNHNAMIVAFLASQRLGLVWVGINRVLATAEKIAQLVDSGARLLLADPQTADLLKAERHRTPALERILTSGVESTAEWLALIAAHQGEDAVCPPPDRLAPAAISYTSGTTGLPKGAVHTQHSIMTFVNAATLSGNGGIWEPGLRRSVTIALTIINAMTYGPLAALASGGSFVSMDRVDATGVAEWIARAGIQILCCTPPTIRDILLKPELVAHDINSLRYVMAGGAAGATEIRSLFKERIGCEIIDSYGLTEAPSGVAESRFNCLPPPGGSGRIHAHVEIVALDSDANPVPPGTVGELGIRARQHGPWTNVFTGMIGYWHQSDETAKVFRNGWLCTGDLGFVDADENLFIVGRLKELIIRGGANVYPTEVERVLRTVDEIEDAVVVGMPDDRLGEIVCSFVKLKDPKGEMAGIADRLTAACHLELARYKVPERWYIVDEIPRNAMNKPNRARLLEMPRREALKVE